MRWDEMGGYPKLLQYERWATSWTPKCMTYSATGENALKGMRPLTQWGFHHPSGLWVLAGECQGCRGLWEQSGGKSSSKTIRHINICSSRSLPVKLLVSYFLSLTSHWVPFTVPGVAQVRHKQAWLQMFHGDTAGSWRNWGAVPSGQEGVKLEGK